MGIDGSGTVRDGNDASAALSPMHLSDRDFPGHEIMSVSIDYFSQKHI